MSYYQGDFYQGDPGFMSFLGRAAGAVGGFIPGIGGLVSAGGKVLSRIGKSKVGQAIIQHPTLSAAGAAGIVGTGTGMLMKPPMGTPASLAMRMGAPTAAGVSARGFHMSKPRRGVPPHLVRNRRMRVTNPRALRRAIRRAKGFERLARKVMHFVSPRAHKGRAVFKTRRRK